MGSSLNRFIDRFARPLIDPSTLLIILGLVGFYLYYPHRALSFLAVGIAIIGIVAVVYKRWESAIPIQTFFLGTWAYNIVENNPARDLHLLEIMLAFLLLLGYGFWKMFNRPARKELTALHGLYLSLATLIVWELAVIIDMFWPVEPWSRTFLVVAALIFLQMAIAVRLSGRQNPRLLIVPLIVILLVTVAIIVTTPLSQT